MIEEFDSLRKHIKSKNGKKEAIVFRRKLKNVRKYTDKLDDYLSLTLDGMSPEEAKKEVGL